MAFSPTHVAADAGTPTWSTPDASALPGPRLDPGLAVRVLEVRGNWARILCANGWEAWVDERRLLPTAAAASAPSIPPAAAVTPVSAPLVAASSSPPGWYPDSAMPGTIRWWDGTRWTEDRRAGGTRAGAQVAASGHSGSIAAMTAVSLAVAVCAFLPWTSSHGFSASSFKLPARFLFDYKNSHPGGLKIGHLLIALAVLLLVTSVVPALSKLSRLIAGVVLIVATVFVAQAQRATSAAGGGGNVFSILGAGVYLAAITGVVGALIPRRRPSAGQPSGGRPDR